MNKIKPIHYVKEKAEKIQGILDFSIPLEKVVKFENNTISDYARRGNDAALYLGKMSKEGNDSNGIYSERNIEGMLRFANATNYNKSPIRVVLGSRLYECLAKDFPTIDVMDFAAQKKLVETAGKRAHISTQILKIENRGEQHKELFDSLEDDGLSCLQKPFTREFSMETSSLELAQFLFQLVQKQKSLKVQIFKTIPPELRNKIPAEHPLSYYALVEVACRLHDFIHGTTTQGGMGRQEIYDNILDGIIHNSYKLRELIPLQNFIGRNHHFSKRYFLNKVYEGLHVKEKEKNGFMQKWKRRTGIAASALLLLLSGTGIIQNRIAKKNHDKLIQQENNNIKDVLKNTNLTSHFHWNTSQYKDNEKVEFFNTTAKAIFEMFTTYYSIPSGKEEEVKRMIANTLIQPDKMDTSKTTIAGMNIDLDMPDYDYNEFIENTLIPANKLSLKILGCDLVPYEDLLPYKNLLLEIHAMKDTITLESQFSAMTRECRVENKTTGECGIVASMTTLGSSTIRDIYPQKYTLVKTHAPTHILHPEILKDSLYQAILNRNISRNIGDDIQRKLVMQAYAKGYHLHEEIILARNSTLGLDKEYTSTDAKILAAKVIKKWQEKGLLSNQQ